jgi:hypothetical protein
MVSIFSPSKLEIFLDTTITGISLLIAFGVYIYLFAIATMVCLDPREYAASIAIASYDGSSTNHNVTAASLPLMELIFPRSNSSQFLRGAATVRQPQQLHRSTNLGHENENNSIVGKDSIAEGAGASIDRPAAKTPKQHTGVYENDMVEKSNFAPSQKLRDAVYSWYVDQDHQVLGKSGWVRSSTSQT